MESFTVGIVSGALGECFDLIWIILSTSNVFVLLQYLFYQIETHELLEMRRIAAYIYKKAGRWQQSVALSKKDKLYQDAMETTSQSGDSEFAEELLNFFVKEVISPPVSRS